MTRKQEAKLNMFNAVYAFLIASADITATISRIAIVLTVFKQTIDSIRTIAQSAEEIITGITDNKLELKNKSCITGAAIAAAVSTYATDNNLAQLKAKMKYTSSDLKAKKDDELPSVLNIILSTANSLIPAPPSTDPNPLVDYGVAAADLTAFQALISDYTDSISAYRNAQTAQSADLEQLETLFKTGSTILQDKLDKLVLKIKATNPEFYSKYQRNRKIVGPRTMHTRVAGKITDSMTGNPVAGVTVTAIGTTSYEGACDDQGNYSVNTPEFRLTYTVKYTCPRYADVQVAGIKVKLGKTTTKDIVMTPMAG